MENGNTSRGRQNVIQDRPRRFTRGQPRVERMEDGLGHPDGRVRYRLRCRATHRCPDCGSELPSGDFRVLCSRCAAKRSDLKHHARVLALWSHGASEQHVARLCIGGMDTPKRRRKRKADALEIRCVCGDIRRVEWHGDGCLACGRDLWGKGVEKSVRKKWIQATDAERLAQLVG